MRSCPISTDMKEKILSYVNAECPFRDTLHWYDCLDSTNTEAKRLARQGAPHGTVLVAGSQTGGRGRMGRSFSSPENMGVYLSVILRPGCPPNQLMHLTCAAGVAMCDAVTKAAGFTPGIKWINDLVHQKRKLGGILTELATDPATGLTDYAIVGIGINCRQRTQDFPPELRDMAASLSMFAERPVDCAALAAAMVEELAKMSAGLFREKSALMARYRSLCVTLGQSVCVHRGDERHFGFAADMDDDGGLVVDFADGTRKTVHSGEVSVRGLYGYL